MAGPKSAGQGRGWASLQRLHPFRKRLLSTTKSTLALIRTSPGVLLFPLLVGAVLIAVGVWAACYEAQKDVAEGRELARNVARNVATQYAQQLLTASSPVEVLANTVMHDPQYKAVHAHFNATASALLGLSRAVYTLQLLPAGVVRLVAPIEREELFRGTDIFSAMPDPAFLASLQDTMKAPGLVMYGPFNDLFGFMTRPALVLRKAIYVPADNASVTFGRPDTTNPVCGRRCEYNATSGMAFWGFASSIVVMDGLGETKDGTVSLSPLLGLQDVGLRYTLTAATGIVVAATAQPPRDPVTVLMDLPGTQWLLAVGPPGSWSPAWLPGVVVVVVVCGALAAGLLLGVLLSRRRHKMLLEALLPRSMIQGLHEQHAATQLQKRDVCYDSPAELLHGVLEALLCGSQPDLRDVVLLRTLLLNNAPWYSPVDAGGKIRAANLDSDVARMLMRQLGNTADSPSSDHLPDHHGASRGSMLDLKDTSALVHSLSAASTDHAAILDAADKAPHKQHDDGRCQDLRGALTCILNPAAYSFSAQPTMGMSGLFTGAVGSGPSGVGPAVQGGYLDTLPSDGVPSPARVNSLRSAQQDCALTEETSDSLRTSDAVLTSPHAAISSPMHQQDNNAAPGGGGGWPPPAKPSLGRRLLQSMLSGVKAAPPAQRSAMAEELAASPDSSSHAGTRPATSPTPLVALTMSGTPATALSAADSATRPRSEVHVLAAPRAAAALDATQLSGPLGALRLGEITSMPPQAVPAAAPGPSEAFTDAGGSVKGLRLVVPAMRRGTSASLGLQGLSATGLWRSTTSAAHMALQSRTSAASTAPSLQQEQGAPEWEAAGRAAAMRVDVSGPRLDEVERLLCCVDGLRYDTWALDAATGGHALSALGFFLLQREGLLARFSLPPSRVIRLLHALEAGYPANPYHSAVHAADVLRSLHVLLHGARLRGHYLDDLGLLAAYFAAAVHDHGHPGLTGDFLVATSHPLALRYNDRSPLESYHAASAFELLAARPDLDITEGMSREDKAAFRKQVIEMVLATDMKQHFAIMGQFTATAHRRKGAPAGQEAAASPSSAEGAAVRTSGSSGPSSEDGVKAAGGKQRRSICLAEAPTAIQNANAPRPTPIDEAERMLSLQVALKVADIGHLSGELGVHKRWLGVLEEEFFRQGDRERQLGLPISPLFDRAKQGVSKSQVGFFDFVALPLVRAFASAFPGAQPMAGCFEANYRHWVEEQAQAQAQEEAQQQGGGKQEHERKSDQAGKQENKQDGQQGARPGDGDRSSRTKAFMRLSSRLG